MLLWTRNPHYARQLISDMAQSHVKTQLNTKFGTLNILCLHIDMNIWDWFQTLQIDAIFETFMEILWQPRISTSLYA